MDYIIKWSPLVILAVLVVVAGSEEVGECFLIPWSSFPECEDNFHCYNMKDFNLIDTEIKTWSCRKYNRKEPYALHVLAEHMTFDEESDKPYIALNAYADHIRTFSVCYGHMTSVPSVIYDFPNITTVNLSGNTLKSFDLGKFAKLANLKTLNVSHNQIVVLEESEKSTSGGFNGLNTLDFSHNGIKAIPDKYFKQFPDLLHLNLSHNHINNINTLTFEGITQLQSLSISNNKIATIGSYFANFVDLRELFIDHNYLTSVEGNNFETMTKLEKLNISFNSIATIDNNAFDNLIQIELLDLSNNEINIFTKTMFQHNNNLKSLNISNNNISKMEQINLIALANLDLSYNQLQSIDFDLSKTNISYLYINNNHIKKITNVSFKSLTTLKVINLLDNAVEEIELWSFKDLNGLESLIINNNPLKTVIPSNLFSGLASVTNLDLTNSKISTIQNNAFNGMESLKTFNASYSNVHFLEKNVFNGTGSIEIIDLSYNEIEIFSLNNANMKLVKRIYLQYNKIQYVTDETFVNLVHLSVVNLNSNNIMRIENNGLKNLLEVNLSINKNILFSSSIFSNLQSLSDVFLNNVTSAFSFQNTENSSITGLYLSHCDIIDINSVYLYQIETLERLNLAFNKIRSIDKISFQKLRNLDLLDLSFNKLTNIQAGSFGDNVNLSDLNLSHNYLSSLPFGVFDGLVNLNTLDLSTNTLHIFGVSLFHKAPRVKTVYLDNNLIEDINFSDFAEAKVTVLSIGGNILPCDRLTRLKKDINLNEMISVKAKQYVYHEENVDGISCKSKTRIDDLSIDNGNQTALTASLIRALEYFRGIKEKMLNRNEAKIDLESIGFKHVSTLIERFLINFNTSETRNNIRLEKLMTLNNNTNRLLGIMHQYMNTTDSVSMYFNKTNETSANHRKIEKKMTAIEQMSIKNEFKGMFDSWKMERDKGSEDSVDVAGSRVFTSALYSIACLVALLVVLVMAIILAYFKFRNNILYYKHLSQSRQIMSNGIEME